MNHNRNAHYWENRDERKERAYLHTKNMAYVFSDHIEQCVRNTKLYDDTNTFDELNPVLTREVSVVELHQTNRQHRNIVMYQMKKTIMH